MTVEWDLLKAKLNFRKHGILFADAVPALEDEFAISVRDSRDLGEERWVTICSDAQMRLMVVVYTWRGDAIRLISARPATKGEQRQYEKER